MATTTETRREFLKQAPAAAIVAAGGAAATPALAAVAPAGADIPALVPAYHAAWRATERAFKHSYRCEDAAGQKGGAARFGQAPPPLRAAGRGRARSGLLAVSGGRYQKVEARAAAAHDPADGQKSAA